MALFKLLYPSAVKLLSKLRIEFKRETEVVALFVYFQNNAVSIE